jgi:hypothetical protein
LQWQVEVQLHNKCFFLKKIWGGASPESKVISWNVYNGIAPAWQQAKLLTHFDAAKAGLCA